MKLDYSDNFIIKVTKVSYGGTFSHWEADLCIKNEDSVCVVTSPTAYGAIDSVIDYLLESKEEWFIEDANKDNKE